MPADSPNLRLLLARSRAGDQGAFTELFESYRPLMHGLAYRLVGMEACEDVVMEACLKAWQSLPEYQSDAALRRWWCRITHNCAMDELRRRRRRTEGVVHTDDDQHRDILEMIPDTQMPSPSEALTQSDAGATLDRAVSRLSPDHRTTLLLREVDGLSYLEIAAATGVSIGTVMSRLFHARRHLKRLLQEELADETAHVA